MVREAEGRGRVRVTASLSGIGGVGGYWYALGCLPRWGQAAGPPHGSDDRYPVSAFSHPFPDPVPLPVLQELSGGGEGDPPVGELFPVSTSPRDGMPHPMPISDLRKEVAASGVPFEEVRPRPDLTGIFTYRRESAALVWDEGMYMIHGYEPGDIVPTLEVGFAHVKPALRDRARAFWDEALSAKGPSAWYYTLIDARSRPRHVLAVTDPTRDGGIVGGIRGFLVDITTSVHDDAHRAANTAVARSAERRAVIEQAKGVLLATQGASAEEAFTCLSRYSQRVNRKVSLLAQDILDATADPQILRALTRSICARH